MSKLVKGMLIEDLRKRIGDHSDILVVNSSKLDAVSDNRFRRGLREKDISVLTVKNSLAKKALGASGASALDAILSGPSCLVWGSEDIISLSKEITRWAKEIAELEVKGGTLEGSTLSAKDVEALSKSPSREELIGEIVGRLLGPACQLLGALQGPGGRLAGQIETLYDKDETD